MSTKLEDLDMVVGRWGLRATLAALTEWCREYSELVEGVDSPERLASYRQCASDVDDARIRFEATVRHARR